MVCDPNSERMTSVLAALDGAPVYGISSRDTVVTIYTSVQDLEAVVNRIHLLNVTKAVSSREGMGLVEVHNSHFDAPYVINEISTNLVFAKLEVHEIVAARTSVRLFINEPDLPKAVQVLEQLKL